MKQGLFLVLLCGALAGCSGVGSVYPICTPYDTVAPSTVLGTWTDKTAEGVMVVSSAVRGSFTLKIREDDGSLSTFDLRLTKIGGALFADVYSGQGGGVNDDFIGMPVHLFAKIEAKGDKLVLYFPDPEWFDRHLSERPSAVRHLKKYPKGEKGWIYLTDDTQRVRAFLKKCAKRPEAFVEEVTLTKVSDSQEPPQASPPLPAEEDTRQKTGK